MRAANRPAAWWSDLRTALALLTRLPGVPEAAAGAEIARAGRVMPLVGALIGLAGGLIFWLGHGFALPPLVAGLLAVAATMLLTGAFHEDGLADAVDALGATAGRGRRLEIMRDSRVGTYGALALMLSLGLRAAALAALAAPGAAMAALIAAHALARACLPPVMAWLPLARSDGLAAQAGRPEPGQAGIALLFGVAIALLALGPGPGLAALVLAALAAGATALLARARLGGYTGDVLGAIEQAAEVAVLIAAAASA